MKEAANRKWVWPLFLGLILFLFYFSIPGLTEETQIVSGERLKYQVYVKGLPIGEQILSIIGETTFKDRSILCIHMDLRSYAAYSFLFSYQESGDLFLDAKTLTPIYLRKRITEKDKSWIEEYVFVLEDERVEKTIIRDGKAEKKTFLQVNQPLLESLSLIYYLRGRPWKNDQYQFYYLSPKGPLPVSFQYKGQEKIRALSNYMMADFEL